jgi:hypothetical protein
LIELNDIAGYDALIEILEDEDAGFARAQASELINAKAGQNFGYNPEKTVTENKEALERIKRWHKRA